MIHRIVYMLIKNNKQVSQILLICTGWVKYYPVKIGFIAVSA